MQSAANASRLVDSAVLFGPAGVLGSLRIQDLEGLKEKVTAAAEHYERTLGGILSFEFDDDCYEVVPGEIRLAGGKEEWMASLEAIRFTIMAMQGTIHRVLFRKAAKFLAPERAADLYRLHEVALKKAIEIRTWLAFMLGEDDDMEEQWGLLPRDDAERAPGPSVDGDFI